MRRWGVRVLAAVLAAAAAGYGTAWLTTDRFGASRAIAWLEADTGDIDRFPARTVRAGGPTLELPAGEPLDLARAWDLDDPEAFLSSTRTVAFLVVQDGTVRYERYLGDGDAGELRTSFSAAKSVVSTLIGLAVADGLIGSVDDPVTTYVPELLATDDRFAAVTLRDLMTMSSGLCYDEQGLPWSDDAQTYYGTDLRRTAESAEVCGPPGATFLYNNYNPLLEGLVLERATGTSVSEYLSARLWGPMGAEADASWSLDTRRSGFEKMESGLNAVARDYARFGLLFARGGRAGDRQVVPAEWVDAATSASAAGGAAPFYGFHWWTGTSDGATFPPGHALAHGNFGQFVYVAPDRDVVIVRLGDDYGVDDWPVRLSRLAASL
ncbi:serine hydrolase [uncultured Cellulomonas sp.]|uniref:serine hydrolase domain-containing protein n=1 Tax=uncultured Cellulomonas sp. TaxID=189682 RepID=UPI00262A9D2C|nr:serine hydrolase [uncultured Cellulomonas sp.]